MLTKVIASEMDLPRPNLDLSQQTYLSALKVYLCAHAVIYWLADSTIFNHV